MHRLDSEAQRVMGGSMGLSWGGLDERVNVRECSECLLLEIIGSIRTPSLSVGIAGGPLPQSIHIQP